MLNECLVEFEMQDSGHASFTILSAQADEVRDSLADQLADADGVIAIPAAEHNEAAGQDHVTVVSTTVLIPVRAIRQVKFKVKVTKPRQS